MHHLLHMTDECQHREHRLHQHPVLPLAVQTQFEIARIALRRMEARVAQDGHRLFELADEPLKGVIHDIGRGARPPHDEPPLIEQQTQFPTDHPAMIREAFAADLLRTPACTHGMEQLDPISIDDTQHRWGGQEELRPVLMGREEAKEACALGEVGKQRPIVARQPAIERPVAHAFEGMEQPQSDDLTGPEVGLRVFGDSAQLLIDLLKQCRDKLHRDHAALLSGEGCHPEQGGGVAGRLQDQKYVLLVFIILYFLSSL
jgi:hypothetical protein